LLEITHRVFKERKFKWQ